MNIRFATADDMPELLRMGEQFHLFSEHAHIEFCRKSAEITALAIIQMGYILLAEHDGKTVGMIGVGIAPMPMNHAVLMAQEVLWWVDHGARGSRAACELIERAEEIARERSAQRISMSALANSPLVVERMYRRWGYRACESAFLKELN